jgi:hypothetical protein
MPLFLLALAAAWPAQSALAQPDLRAPTAADRAAIVNKGWAASRDLIGQMLAKAYEPSTDGSPGSTGQPGFESWLRLWQWCELLSRDENAEAAKFLGGHLYMAAGDPTPMLVPPGEDVPGNLTPASAATVQMLMASPRVRDEVLGQLLRADSMPPQSRPLAELAPPKILAEWLGDEELSRRLFANLSPDDYAPGVLRALAQIRQEQPEKFAEYRSLALAIALVYDQKMPADWPHAQVAPAEVPIRDYRPADWFAFWVQSNESQGSLTDLRSLSPEQAKFVVDAPLDASEYAWARANVRLSRADFAQAYDMITYDTKRLADAQYVWPASPYTLAAIQKQGGICVDQAYFAMVAGKARGLPTLFFTGEGADGGHAWFGYLQSDNHWEMDCGRYEDQKFATGEALDPQTWKRLSDHELAFLEGHFRAKPEYAASQDDLVMAGLLEGQGQDAPAAAALDSALAVCPMNAAAWDAKTAFLERTGAPAEALRAHHEAAARQFASQPDLKAEHLAALAALARQTGDTAAASAYENQIISQNAGDRADLGVQTLAKQILDLAAAGQLDDAFKKYQQQVDDIGRNGGSGFFYEVVQPLVSALLAAGEQSRAKEAMELARAALNAPAGTTLERDMDALDEQVLAATPVHAPAGSASHEAFGGNQTTDGVTPGWP